VLLLCSAILASLAFGAASAAAAGPAVAWQIDQASEPTYLPPGKAASGGAAAGASPKYHLTIVNVGGSVAEGVTVTDVLPRGVRPSSVVPAELEVHVNQVLQGEPCETLGQAVTCNVAPAVQPGDIVAVYIPIDVEALEPGVTDPLVIENSITVSSTNGPTLARNFPTTVSSQAPPYEFLGTHGLFGGAYDEAGAPPSAGSHPFSVNLIANTPTTEVGGFVRLRPKDYLRNVSFELPPGMVLNPRATPRCSQAQFEGGSVRVPPNPCPASTQIGTVEFNVLGAAGLVNAVEPLFNLEPPAGVPAEVGFSIAGTTRVHAQGGLSGTFRLSSVSSEILAKFPVPGIRVELWGNPSDPRHDYHRQPLSCGRPEGERGGCSVPAATEALLTMPTSCRTPLALEAAAGGWEGSSTRGEASFTTTTGQTETVGGCERLSFEPTVSVKAQAAGTATPTGLAFNLQVPQNEGVRGLATATLKRVSVQLPEGFTVNPGLANGLSACSQEQIGLGNNSPAACPNASKIGSAEIETPLLETPLKGSVYLAEQTNNPFGTLLALYLAVEGEGVVIKLPGRVDLDPSTGRLTTTFDDNPQLPFDELRVNFNGGDGGARADLITPNKCGTYKARTELTSWASSTPVVLETPMTVSQGCATGGFRPGLVAGTSNPAAGRYSPFTLRVTRADGEQNLSRITTVLPDGLLAKLAGVTLCPDAQVASGDCPADSQVGSTTTGVGAGSSPLYIAQPGKAPTAVYLAGPYKGAPYSLVVKVPAQAGPFDLGTVVVRVALDVDPFTAQVTATSDPLPQILEGIPVAYRDVRIEMDRSQFMLNPTSCEPMQILSTLVSDAGATASPSSRFQVAGCSGLAFRPSLKLSLRGSTKRAGHPGLKAVLTYPKKGEFANIRRAQVNLPHSEFLDQGNLNKTCTRPVLLEGKCPRTSIYGKAKAWTPLLERPLEGPVYLVGGFGYKLPAMVAELGGQIRVLLKGKVDTGPNKGIRNTFEAVPDAPVSRFVLELKGGRKYSLLENSENLCSKRQKGIARFVGQNGAVDRFEPVIRNDCKKKGSGKR
jgi:uncharacterized repeat protein (TIGR01451 family)